MDVERVAALIRDARPRSIVVLVGAGVSVSAGIPDFRTPGTGLYDNLQKYNLPFAEAIFDIDYFRHTPAPFYTLCGEMWPGQYAPTVCHRFFKAIHDSGKLLRLFTQNIDSLEREAGLPPDAIVAAHGNFDSAHVVAPDEPVAADGSVHVEGRKTVDIEKVRQAISEGEAGWQRLNTRHGGLVKPAITFFGESLPKRFARCAKSDFASCELLLVFGTSLMVQPFASLVRFPPRGTPRFLVNRERRGEDMGLDFDSPGSTYGVFLGDCDDGARQLADLLGWDLLASSQQHATLPSSPSTPAKVRIGLTKSATAKAAECVVLTSPEYDEIVRAAANKLKLSPRSITRLVLRTPVLGHPPGTELPHGDCSALLKNDVLLWVSVS